MKQNYQRKVKQVIAMIMVVILMLSLGIGSIGTIGAYAEEGDEIENSETIENIVENEETDTSDSDTDADTPVLDEVASDEVSVDSDVLNEQKPQQEESNEAESPKSVSDNDIEMVIEDVSNNDLKEVKLSLYYRIIDADGNRENPQLLDTYSIRSNQAIPNDILSIYGEDTIWYLENGSIYDMTQIVNQDISLFKDMELLKDIYYTGQTIPEILDMVKQGLDLKEFFKYTAFHDFEAFDLEMMRQNNITLEGLMMYAYLVPEIKELEQSTDKIDQMTVEKDYELLEEESVPKDNEVTNENTVNSIATFSLTEEDNVISDEDYQILLMNDLITLLDVEQEGILNYRGKVTSELGNIPQFGTGSHGGINTRTMTTPDGEVTAAWCAKYGAPAHSGMTYKVTTGADIGFSAEQQRYIAMAVGWYYYFTSMYQLDGANARQLNMIPQVFTWLAAAGNMYTSYNGEIANILQQISAKAYGNQEDFNPANMETYFVACFAYMTKTAQLTSLGKEISYPAEKCIPADITFWSNGNVNQWMVTGVLGIDEPVMSETFSKVDAESLNPLSPENLANGAEFAVYSDAGFTNKVADCTNNGDGTYTYPLLDIAVLMGANPLNPITEQTFYVKETTAPYGYYLDPDIQWTITCIYDRAASITASTLGSVAVKNDYQYLDITVNKVDNESGQGPQGDASLDGAIYALYAAEDIQHPDGLSGTVYGDGEFIEVAVIENGTASFAHLYEGAYTVVEVQDVNPPEDINNLTYTRTADGRALSAATGYLIDESRLNVTVRYDGNENNSHRTENVTSYEQVMKASAYFYKYATETGNAAATPLPGAGFTVYLVSDLTKADAFTYDVLRNGQNAPILDAEGNRIPSYTIDSILEAYLEKNWFQTGEIGAGKTSKAKYDFRDETAAIAKLNMTANDNGTFNIGANHVDAANYYSNVQVDVANLQNIGGTTYQVKELISDDKGLVSLPYLPYGQYLIVETTTPKDRITADPFLLTIYPSETMTGITNMGVTDKTGYGVNVYQSTVNAGYAVQSPLEANYFTGVVNNEAIEEQLKIYKEDADTFEDVILANTGFQIYRMMQRWNDALNDGAGGYEDYEQLMVQQVFHPVTQTYDTFYTEADGTLKLPYLLAAGSYRIKEVQGPNGYWLNRDNTIEFKVTTDREYYATGETTIVNQVTQAARDIIQIKELYYNNETRGHLNIEKYGERITGMDDATDGYFTYTDMGIEGAEFTVTAAEDIYTQDRQVNEDGSRKTWFLEGETVAVVQTGSADMEDTILRANQKDGVRYLKDGTTSENALSEPFGSLGLVNTNPDLGTLPGDDGAALTDPRTYAYNEQANYQGVFDNDMNSETVNSIVKATYDGTLGKVSIELPLGSYWIEESAAPNGYTRSLERYLVSFTWEQQENEFVQGELIGYDNGEIIQYKYAEDGSLLEEWSLVEEALNIEAVDQEHTLSFQSKDAENITDSKFYNQRVTDSLKVTKYATEDHTSLIPGVEFTLFNQDPVYVWDGDVNNYPDGIQIIPAGTAIEKAVSDMDGVATFKADLPVAGLAEKGPSEGQQSPVYMNTGKYYIVETDAPSGVLIDPVAIHFEKTDDNTFTWESENIVYSPLTKVYASSDLNVSIEGTQYNRSSYVAVSKEDITNSKEIEGAHLTVVDKDNVIVRDFYSSADKPETIRGLDVNYNRAEILEYLDDKNVGTYYSLVETKPADGYTTATAIDFMLVAVENLYIPNEDGNAVLNNEILNDLTNEWNEVYIWDETENLWVPADNNMVHMLDDTTKISISKQDITNKTELPGAHLTITDKNGTVVDDWTSTDKPHLIENVLIVGESYTLTEITAPAGYEIAERIQFTVLDSGKVQQVTMYDTYVGTPTKPKKDHPKEKEVEIEVQAPSAEAEMAEAQLHDKTGEEVNKYVCVVTGVLAFVIAIASMVIVRKKRTEKSKIK